MLGAGKKVSNIMTGGEWNFPSVLPYAVYYVKICQDRERPNWATSLKWTFFQYGFRNVWLYNGQGHVDVFLKYLEKD